MVSSKPFLAVLCFALSAAALQVTPLERHVLMRRDGYASSYDTCFSPGAICQLYQKVPTTCPDPAGDDPKAPYRCQCETTGYVAALQAWVLEASSFPLRPRNPALTCGSCANCQASFGVGTLGGAAADAANNCAQEGLKVGPLPSPIVSAWSAFNATHTPAAGPAATGLPTAPGPAPTRNAAGPIRWKNDLVVGVGVLCFVLARNY